MSGVPDAGARSGALPGEGAALLAAFGARYPFPLDPFQEEAIRHILEGASVIVSAPTGAGKTLIAEFAITRAFAAGTRLAYTTPLKALSNQKFADFTRQYGAERVGILTGDVKVNPRAPLVVMTTEILRNMLYTRSLEEIGYVVLDECHYMGDESRGTVWEEIIINCPREVLLVALSATVGNIEEIAAWIASVHGPIRVVKHTTRPVPLHYHLCDTQGHFVPLDGLSRSQLFEALRGGFDPRRLRLTRARPGRPRPFVRRRPASPLMVIPGLRAKRWLPAIYFIFSRAGCEGALRRFLEEDLSLLEPHREREVEEAIEAFRAESPTVLSESELNAMLFEGLRRGAGVHHAGILPAIKRLTETLFERGLTRVVFATETMSLGIHMPAKSVFLQSLTKRTDTGFRTVTHNELTQMAGRAGRRGIDPEGKCIVALDGPEGVDEALYLIRRASEPVESRFRIGYSSAALLLHNYPDPPDLRRNIESSFGQFQNRKRIEGLEREVAELTERLRRGRGGVPECGRPGCNLLQYRAWREALEAARTGQVRLPGRPGRRRGPKHRERLAVPPRPIGDLGEGIPAPDPSRIPDLLAALSQSPCHRCPERPRMEKHLKRQHRVAAGIEARERTLAHLRSSYWDQFCRVVDVLKHFRYVQGNALAKEGHLVAGLRHDNELLVARVVFAGILDDLPGEEVMSLLSCLVEEPRETDSGFARVLLKRWPHLRQQVRAMEDLAGNVLAVQQEHRVTLPVSMHTTLIAATYEWAAGEEDWVHLVEAHYGGHEGDLIRAFRRLIDLSRQLVDAPEVAEPLRASLWQGVKTLDRGIVLESALI
ncbi:MAG: DEAD/DEAH box helicase [candidate division NC10 bacterium]|nr:DEAD/DEAH box helicase [candidate division NC10 bacterium]